LGGFAKNLNKNFLTAEALAVLMTTMTVSFQSTKSAFANPVDSLRNE
jgi:hypothetical protein